MARWSDVRAAEGHAAVVEDDHLGAGLREVRCERFLAGGTGVPGGLAGRRGLNSQQEVAEVGVALAGLGLTPCSAPFVLAPGATAGGARIDLVPLGHRNGDRLADPSTEGTSGWRRVSWSTLAPPHPAPKPVSDLSDNVVP
jgi:hypothetical protein